MNRCFAQHQRTQVRQASFLPLSEESNARHFAPTTAVRDIWERRGNRNRKLFQIRNSSQKTQWAETLKAVRNEEKKK
jgi:hypothetical protein